jgi:hypothetical protein
MAFNLPDTANTLIDSTKGIDSLRKEFKGVMNKAQTIEKSNPAAEFTMNHNLYNLLGSAVISSLKQGHFNSSETEGYLKDLLNLQFMIDFENKYGMNFQTGPSERSPGTRDFNLNFTKDF